MYVWFDTQLCIKYKKNKLVMKYQIIFHSIQYTIDEKSSYRSYKSLQNRLGKSLDLAESKR